MTNSGLGPGQSPLGGSRHRSRPARPVFAQPAREPDLEDDQPRIGQSPEALAVDVCPWLYLNIEPDTRGESVTDDHRCELVPDVTPGPGHQVAYCLTPNHRACPQLRGYEAQRRTSALGAAQQAQIVPFPVPLQQAAPPRSARTRHRDTSRWLWAALSAVGALLLAAGVALYTMPAFSIADSEQDIPDQSESQQLIPPAPTASPPLVVPTTQAPIQNIDTPNWNASAGDATGAAEDTNGANDDTQVPDTYVVELGDTLSSIARRFGVTIDALITANDLGNGSLLVTVGDQLVIPSQ